MKALTSNLAGQRLQLNGRVHTADQKIQRPCVQISPDAGLSSTTSFLYFLSHLLINWQSVLNWVPQGGASLLIMRQPKISISSCAACGQTSVKYSQNGIKQKEKSLQYPCGLIVQILLSVIFIHINHLFQRYLSFCPGQQAQ